MPKHKSISQMLRYKHPPQDKMSKINTWVQAKQNDFFTLHDELSHAIKNNDTALALELLYQVKDLHIKSFKAIPNIAQAMLATPSDGNYGDD